MKLFLIGNLPILSTNRQSATNPATKLPQHNQWQETAPATQKLSLFSILSKSKGDLCTLDKGVTAILWLDTVLPSLVAIESPVGSSLVAVAQAMLHRARL